MEKQLLTRANTELFRRSPDQMFASLNDLAEHCARQKEASLDRWQPPVNWQVQPSLAGPVNVRLGGDGAFELNDWSFGQLCRVAGVGKETVNRLSPDTVSRVFAETLPSGNKPLQVYTQGEMIRSIHGTSYTRLYDLDLVNLVREFAVDFQPPQAGFNGATGLYAGEQDLFMFLIDPAGWTEIEGEAFAPGFFLFNSEVGKRSLGVQTFWFQKVCQNHLVWDAVEVIDFTRKHTASVHDAFGEIRRIIENLVAKRDQRRDAFVKIIAKAMHEKLGDDADEVFKVLAQQGVSRNVAKQALEMARQQGGFTIFSLVDTLTKISGKIEYAGDRTQADAQAARLLALAV
jgi:hypothetical protein